MFAMRWRAILPWWVLRSSDAATLAEFLRSRLARYEIPTDIAIVAELPRTPSGKPDLTAIRGLFSDTVSAAQSDHAG